MVLTIKGSQELESSCHGIYYASDQVVSGKGKMNGFLEIQFSEKQSTSLQR